MSNFNVPNPYAMDAIARASEQYDIVASEDILDAQGRKLWARSQPISAALREKLLQRKLTKPLESCVRIDGGVSGKTVADEAAQLLETDVNLKALAGGAFRELRPLIGELRLHEVIVLLLTVGRNQTPAAFPHAVRGMLLAGWLAVESRLASTAVKSAMLAGLLHDIGEMYVNPDYLRSAHALSLEQWKHVAVHPRIAELLLTELTDYPKALAQAIGEHHERLDGSGYPSGVAEGRLSQLGQIAGVTELLLGILGAPDNQLARASLALRLVPQEFDPALIAAVCRIRPSVQGPSGYAAEKAAAKVTETAARLDESMTRAEQLAAAAASAPPALAKALGQAYRRLKRLSFALVSTGVIEAAPHGSASEEHALDFEAVPREIAWRLRFVGRQLWLALESEQGPWRAEVDPFIESLLAA
jgi:hypothetical protein